MHLKFWLALEILPATLEVELSCTDPEVSDSFSNLAVYLRLFCTSERDDFVLIWISNKTGLGEMTAVVSLKYY